MKIQAKKPPHLCTRLFTSATREQQADRMEILLEKMYLGSYCMILHIELLDSSAKSMTLP